MAALPSATGFVLNAGGMIAVTPGVLLVAAWRFGPFGPARATA